MEDKEKCKCGDDAEPPHPCPFKEDIHGDDETLCTCCKSCRHDCLMDI
jgi:hypothetical protein